MSEREAIAFAVLVFALAGIIIITYRAWSERQMARMKLKLLRHLAGEVNFAVDYHHKVNHEISKHRLHLANRALWVFLKELDDA